MTQSGMRIIKNGENFKRSVQRLGSWMGEGDGKESLNCCGQINECFD